MVQKEAVKTDKAPPPMPFFSQAIKCQGMVYCSGSVGMDPVTKKLVEGGVADRAVRSILFFSSKFPLTLLLFSHSRPHLISSHP
jgi:enamine deaminase RidA (YjgF/YER057c/UK114 family)